MAVTEGMRPVWILSLVSSVSVGQRVRMLANPSLHFQLKEMGMEK